MLTRELYSKAYFEHNTLPRRKWTRSNRQVDNKKKQYCSWNRILDRSSPGEDRYETKLYHPLTTPLSQMGDFGISWGMCKFIDIAFPCPSPSEKETVLIHLIRHCRFFITFVYSYTNVSSWANEYSKHDILCIK